MEQNYCHKKVSTGYSFTKRPALPPYSGVDPDTDIDFSPVPVLGVKRAVDPGSGSATLIICRSVMMVQNVPRICR
jgi:hypothetical protein